MTSREVGGNRGHRNSNLPGAQRRVGIEISPAADFELRRRVLIANRHGRSLGVNQQPVPTARTKHPRRGNPAPPPAARLSSLPRARPTVGRRIGIDQHDPPGMLGLRRPHHPHTAAPKSDIFARYATHRGHHHQTPPHHGQPRLQHQAPNRGGIHASPLRHRARTDSNTTAAESLRLSPGAHR